MPGLFVWSAGISPIARVVGASDGRSSEGAAISSGSAASAAGGSMCTSRA
jgi:hypothetical protein